VTSPDYGRAYAAAIEGARFAMIDQAGHFPHLEQPAAFAKQVESFIEEMAA
jgi:pimeloyl-ACP methyl ester carboxylesterase